jgi:transcriptional regulator with XRE-family HTH domain
MSTCPERRGKALGPILRAVREGSGETRERVAVTAGLSVGTLARIELDRSDPVWSTIVAIADALGLKLAELGKLMDHARQEETSGRGQPKIGSCTRGLA